MKILIAVVVLWAICGFYAWGTFMADYDYRNQHERHFMDNAWFFAEVAAFGSVGAVGAALLTNFNQYGWELWKGKHGE